MAGLTQRHRARHERPVRPKRSKEDVGKESRDILDAELGGEDAGSEDQFEEEAREETEETLGVKMVPQPVRPSARQIAEHELTHLPYRNWCVHCVKGRARSDAHRRRTDRPDMDDGVICATTWSMDYCDLTDNVTDENGEESREHNTVLVCHDSRTGGVMSNLVEQKGIGDGWIVEQVLQDIEDFGYSGKTIKVKTDQENAILDLQRDIVRRRACGLTVPGNSPVGESQANGRVENANNRVEGIIRTLRSDLESALGVKISGTHPVFPWLVRWAGELITRQVVGENGKTAAETVRGRASLRPLVKFGERVMYMPMKPALKKDNRAKLDDRMLEGIFLGVKLRSDEVIVGTSEGVIKTRTIKRLPEDNQ